jgi:N-acetylglutamate synthase-like GNAT family acetyltransferase
MAFRIRMMKDSDVVAVCGLAHELGYELNDGQFFGRFSLLSQNQNHSLWVIDSAETGVVAFMHLEKSYGLIHLPRLEVRALIVNKKFRGKGLGKRFVLYAESVARTEETSQIYLTSNVVREDTHAFYKSYGYENVKTSLVFVKNL